MPRDGSGNYTLPGGNPVVTGEIIASTWANTTMSDVATALTDSLSRTGSGGMISAFRFADGTVNAPGATWTNEQTSGLYRAASQDFRFGINQADVLRFTPGAIAVFSGGSFRTVFHVNNDGASSGLDADLLDGSEGAFYRDAANLNAGVLADARVQASNVTQHQAALTIAASQIGSGTFADARISQSSVTQHQAALVIAASQITSGTFADARISLSSVSQHQASLETRNITGRAGIVKTLSTSAPSGGANGDIWYRYA